MRCTTVKERESDSQSFRGLRVALSTLRAISLSLRVCERLDAPPDIHTPTHWCYLVKSVTGSRLPTVRTFNPVPSRVANGNGRRDSLPPANGRRAVFISQPAPADTGYQHSAVGPHTPQIPPHRRPPHRGAALDFVKSLPIFPYTD